MDLNLKNSTGVVASERTAVRFIPFSRLIRKGDNSVKPDAFSKHNASKTTSCSEINEIVNEDMWELALPLINRLKSKFTGFDTVHGYASFDTTLIYSNELKAEYTPPPRHFEIFDWSINDALELNQQTNLANNSIFIKNPNKK